MRGSDGYRGQLGYQTEYADASTNEPGVGLLYLQQRYYDPAVGRFTSPDPLGLTAGLNQYEYASGDPVNRADPSGLEDEDPEPGDSNDLQDRDPVRWWEDLVRQSNEIGFRELLRRNGMTPEQWYQAEAEVLNRQFDEEIKQLPPELLEKYPWLRPRGGVYQLEDPDTGEVCRTGRTNDLERRRGEHRRDPKTAGLRFRPRYYTNDAAVRRGLEQLLFEDSPGAALNRIRGIAPSNPNRQVYLDAAARFIEQTMPGSSGP